MDDQRKSSVEKTNGSNGFVIDESKVVPYNPNVPNRFTSNLLFISNQDGVLDTQKYNADYVESESDEKKSNITGNSDDDNETFLGDDLDWANILDEFVKENENGLESNPHEMVCDNQPPMNTAISNPNIYGQMALRNQEIHL